MIRIPRRAHCSYRDLFMRSETVLLVEDDNRIIKELKAARDLLAAAIECLERLDAGRGRKRGRPPAWLNERGEGNHPGNADAPERACEKRAWCATRNTRNHAARAGVKSAITTRRTWRRSYPLAPRATLVHARGTTRQPAVSGGTGAGHFIGAASGPTAEFGQTCLVGWRDGAQLACALREVAQGRRLK